VVRVDIKLCRHHAAAQIDANRRRNNRVPRGHYRSYRRANAQMYIWHYRKVWVDNWQARNILQLIAGFIVNRHALGP